MPELNLSQEPEPGQVQGFRGIMRERLFTPTLQEK
jgi:hypothetical protein